MMTKNILLDRCLAILYNIKEDDESLKTLLNFMENEFIMETQEDVVQLIDYKLQIDEKYRLVVKEIAEYLSIGHIVFVNPKTFEIETIPINLDSFMTDFEFDYKKVEDCVEIEPLESHESYEVMESFVANLPKGKEKEILSNAVSGYKPFANFNRLIHNSDERENWFKYRTCWFEKYVIDNHLTKIIEQKK